MRICYPCGDVFTPDDWEKCPKCGRELRTEDDGWLRRMWRKVMRLVGAHGFEP
jgi:uncharacterized paraquat-inducible protein A